MDFFSTNTECLISISLKHDVEDLIYFKIKNFVRSNNLSLISKVSAFQSEDLGFATNSKVPIPIPLHSDDVNFRYFKLEL